jgi:hypothetical protein
MKSKDGYGIPEIFEDEAAGRLQLIYNDIQYVLKVPIVNFIFRTTALYEAFFVLGWNQVRPNLLTVNVERAAHQLRHPSLDIHIPKINWHKYYDAKTIETIQRIIYTFNYVNTKLLLIASAWSESLAHRTILGGNTVEGYIQPGVIPELPKIQLVHIPNAPKETRQLLLDIARVHQTYDVASDYRALANYPNFLAESWNYLREYVGTDEYNITTATLKSCAIDLAHKMPFSVITNKHTLTPYYSESDIAGIMGVVAMFQNFLPGLIIDGEFFRRIITAM